MARTGRPKQELILSSQERDQLVRWARRASSAQSLALRSKIVLACADGGDNTVVAERLRCSRMTVGKWRNRFLEHRLDGLLDEQRTGRPPTISVDQVEGRDRGDLGVDTAERDSLDTLEDGRADRLVEVHDREIWRKFDLKPHCVDHFKLSTDPLFIDKLYDVVGLYLNPPEASVVLCVDEKSQVQALQRSQPALPLMPGMPERRTHDYVRHGTTTLFAAMNTADGTVITSLHRRHRATEFKKFLTKIEDQVPEELQIHLICDNYGTHKHPIIKTWLEDHPRVHLHFTPTYSSWLNLVERFFGYVTADLLQRSDHRSVQALESDIRTWVKAWNENPKPFVWTKTADQILSKLGRLIQRTSNAGH